MDHWLKTGSLKHTKENYEGNTNVSDNYVEKCSDMATSDNCDNKISEPCEPSVSLLNVSAAKKMKKAHKYVEEYLKLQFSWTGDEVEPVPLCVICYENLTNERSKYGQKRKAAIIIKHTEECRYYVLQADESTDIVNLANLLLFVRYELNNEVYDEILFCQPMPTHTTEEAIFKVINDFIKNNDLNWSRVGISTDGARAMIGSKKGAVACIQAVAPEVKSTHCCIHREAHATQNMQADLKQVLDEAVKIIHFVKGRHLNAWLFSQLCDEMGSDYTQLLFHTEARWLSHGKVLNRLFELREELHIFLDETFNL
ncbi:hypothetical protein KIL84_020386 [Mauremys mutica]|uniref:Uncharacterized protein n=1 Tax=Mauremys mutica TaxID=74926 RepID=A0A9D3XXJ5_9SAUR|nr:hypothetical protein KIL84_020386 [Mauremys mutica]